MKHNFLINYFLTALLVIYTLFFPLNSFALQQYAKQWLGINSQQTWDENKKWHSLVFSQFRFIDQNNPLQAALLEGAIGYQPTLEKSFWFGYRWTALNPYNGFTQENRFFQEMIVQKRTHGLYHVIFRSRLEEITHGNANQVAMRFRQRFALLINRRLFKNAFPFLYDEIFFQLNHPNYMPHTFIGENRVFIGFNLHRTKKSWWEIGYINQYQIRTPQQSQNQMSHILSVTDNFS